MMLDDKEIQNGFVSPVCSFCKHWFLLEKRCKAFEVIPDEIWEGKNNHKKAYNGDNGIKFERDKL
jgi:hypothetical protein